MDAASMKFKANESAMMMRLLWWGMAVFLGSALILALGPVLAFRERSQGAVLRSYEYTRPCLTSLLRGFLKMFIAEPALAKYFTPVDGEPHDTAKTSDHSSAR